MPTGTGKTYNVLQFIKSYLKQNQEKKIFFVTTLKKNLDDPYNELIKELDNDPDLQDSVFRVLSNTEHAIKNFNRIKKDIKNSEIRSSEEFRSFDALITAGVNKPDAFGDLERNFRYLISKTLSRKFKKKSEKLNAIKNDKDWQWVGELYPVVFSEEKRVFFITMKKLINKYDTIIEKSVRLYETSFFRNSLVFIDEFDATKKDIQDMIVQNGLK
jgi:Rad3-related DNA helicase